MNSQLTVIRNYLEMIIVDYWYHMVNTCSDQQFVGGGELSNLVLKSISQHIKGKIQYHGGGGERKSYGFIFARLPNVMKRI